MRNQLFMIGLLTTMTGALPRNTTIITTTKPKTDAIVEPYNIETTKELSQPRIASTITNTKIPITTIKSQTKTLSNATTNTVTTWNTVIFCISGLLIPFTLSVTCIF